MLDGLLGRGFSSKCKSLIAKIKNRTDILKRKKRAVIGYLKKDMAELLGKGYDTKAYSRVEALLVEINRGCCYELIEKFCDCILSQLSSMQKQGDCPAESMEAVSTVMFAAARFADLPELCDLRRLFAEKYGSTLEVIVNQEFIDKVESKPASVDQKVQLMQIIAQEFSVDWNAKAFRQKISNPSTKTYDMQKRQASFPGIKESAAKEKRDDWPNGSEPRFGSMKAAKKDANKKGDTHEEGYLSDGEEGNLRLVSTSKKGIKADRSDILAQYPLRRVKEDPDTSQAVKKEVKADRIDTHQKDHLSYYSRERAEPNPIRFTNHQEVAKDDRNLHAMSAGGSKNVQSGSNQSLENMKPAYANIMPPPPYVKPDRRKDNVNPATQTKGSDDVGYTNQLNHIPERVQMGSDQICAERELVGRPKSPPYCYGMGQNNAVPDAKPRPRSVRRRLRKAPSIDQDGSVGPETAAEDSNGRSEDVHRDGHTAAVDEEEERMDELLLIYCKKNLTPAAYKSSSATKVTPTGNGFLRSPQEGGGERLRPESIRVPTRAVSLPAAPPTEVSKVPARAASFEPDICSPNGDHVHPKLPDYDEIAARFAALRGVRKR